MTWMAVFLLLAVSVRNNSHKTYWKRQYLESKAWIDTLYEENLRLSDTIINLRNDNYLLKQHLPSTEDTSNTIVKIPR